MRLLFTMDAGDYDQNGRAFVRHSARCITIQNGRVAMVHSLKYDYYKFPDGGIEPDETPVQALIREMPSVQTEWIENDAQRKEAQTKVLHDGDHRELMRMIKSLHIRRRDRLAAGKRFHQADERALDEAENLLYQEFAQVLGLKPEEILPLMKKSALQTAEAAT